LGILGIENRKLKIVNCKFLSFQASNNYQIKIKKIKNSRVRAGRVEGREGEGRGGRECVRPRGRVLSIRTLRCVRAAVIVLPPYNFIIDAIVRPSHGRPSGHRPIVRPSVIVHVTALPTGLSCAP
jgi:hypothetical protein